MRLGIDLDGCVYDFTSALRDYIFETTGRPKDEMSTPTCWTFYADDWGYTLEEYLKFCNEGVDAYKIFREGYPMPGAIQALRRLRGRGHTLHIITDRSFGTQSQSNTIQWLEDWDIPYDTINFSKDKTVVPTDMFIDDRPSNIVALRNVRCDAYLYAEMERKDQHDFIKEYGHDKVIYSWREFEFEVSVRTLEMV